LDRVPIDGDEIALKLPEIDVVRAQPLMIRNRTRPPRSTFCTSGSARVRRLARNASYWTHSNLVCFLFPASPSLAGHVHVTGLARPQLRKDLIRRSEAEVGEQENDVLLAWFLVAILDDQWRRKQNLSSLPISRRENASGSRRHSRQSSKSLAKTCKSGSHKPVAPRSRIHGCLVNIIVGEELLSSYSGETTWIR
jgi:hypothetical protein